MYHVAYVSTYCFCVLQKKVYNIHSIGNWYCIRINIYYYWRRYNNTVVAWNQKRPTDRNAYILVTSDYDF